jgi:hypothetical protein
MSDDIKELKTIAARLNKSSDALNESLNQINDKLNQMNIGLTVWLQRPTLLNRLIDDSTEQMEIIGYAKTSAGWGLAVKTVTDQHGYFEGDTNCPYTTHTEEEALPLIESSRDLRVGAIKLLPDLITLIKERAENALENIEIAKELAAEL